jgi:LytS/YehU family sensor histidine kinase
MSLQLLVENAVKHNNTPLYLQIRMREGFLEVKNNLSPVHVPEPGTGMGLANLNERCKILLHREIEVIKDQDSFTVRLPLLK